MSLAMGAGDNMLNNITHLTFVKAGWHQAGDHVVAFAFFGAAGIAMVAWIAAIAWASWHLIAWIFL
jgi:hypothetical protein